MSSSMEDHRTKPQLIEQNEELRRRLEEAEQTLEAIRSGDVDALVVTGLHGEQVYTLTGAEHIYRVIVETMNEAALTVDLDGTILFCNQRFCDLMKTTIHETLGRKVTGFAARPQQPPLKAILADAQAGPVQQHLVLRASDGMAVPVQLSASLLQANDTTSICLVASDLTELEASANSIRVQGEHEQALQNANERLHVQAEELQSQAEELHVQADELKTANADLRESQNRFKLLSETAGRLLEAQSPQKAVDKLCRKVMAHLNCEVFFNFLVDEQAGRLHLNAWAGISEEEAHKIEWLDYGVAVCGCVARDGVRIVANDIGANPDPRTDVVAAFGVRACACHPLRARGKVLGTLSFGTRTRTHFKEEDLSLMKTVADQVAIAIERIRAEEALRQSGEQFHRLFEDDLTGNFISTLEGRILLCNPAFARMFGFATAVDAVGTSILDQYIDANQWETLLETLRQERKVERLESWRRRRDGKPIYVVENLVGHVDSQSELYEVKGYFFDDTERKLAEEELRQSEDRFHRLFEDDLTGNFISTVDGRILLCNPAFARIFGSARAVDAVGTSILDSYIDPTEREPLLERLRQEGKIERLEVWRKRRNGEPIYIVENLVGLFNDRGELYEIKGYLIDDTERKRAAEALQESEEKYRTLFNSIDEGFCIIEMVFDADGRPTDYRFLEINPAFEKQTGLHEAKGKLMRTLAPDHEAHWFETYGRIALTGEPARFMNEAKALNRWYDVYAFRVGGQESRKVAILFDDITERRRTEEALRDLTKTLEVKVAQRTAELERRARQLQKLALELSEAEDRERKRVAEILHDDLQQELAAARFHLNLLKNRAKRDPSQQAIADKVDDLLGDSIQKSRTLSHDLSPVVLYYGDLGEALRWLAGQVLVKHGLVVRVDAFGEVNSQSDALKAFLYKAAQEMLFNVVKHARIHEARIRVRRLGRYICLSVSDRGRGFDPRSLRETAGFGLLSIRERVELLGGRMKIRSAEGQGSTFHVVVPDGVLSKKDVDLGQGLNGAAKQAERGEGRGEHRLRVLLADDHEIVREGMASLLSGELSIEVVGEAANGREAVDLAYKLRPDVVVMDVAMPLINGDDATRQIKTHLPETRIVALSMYDEAETVERMYRAGAESYVLKTAPSDDLIAAIHGKVIRLPAAGDCPIPHP